MAVIPNGDTIPMGEIMKVEDDALVQLQKRIQIRGGGSLSGYGFYLPSFNEQYVWETVFDNHGQQILIYRRKDA